MSILFFCEKCGKPMWEFVDWLDICHLTLEEIEEQLICSDCLLNAFFNILIIADSTNHENKIHPSPA
jgi:hypothetical protein